MVLPTLRLVFDRKGQSTNILHKSPKTGLVQIEVYYNRKRKWIGTGVKVYKNQWSDSLHVINHPQSLQLNSELQLLMSRGNKYINEKFSCDEVFDFCGIENAICMKSCPYDNISEAMQAYVDKLILEGVQQSTVNNYRNVMTKVDSFDGIMSISDVDYDNIVEFDRYLQYTCKLKDSTRIEYHRKFSAMIKWLVMRGWVKSNPYAKFKLKKGNPADTVRYLTTEECAAIEFHDFGDDKMNYVRDVFTFMRYTGMAFSDATRISLDDIEIRDCKRVVVSNRKKTGVRFMVVIFEPAYQILKKYGRLDKYSISYVDVRLNIIGLTVLGKKVTTHMARHSFACWALKQDVSVSYISRMLGHTNIETTQIYAEVIGHDLIEQSKKMELSIHNKPEEANVVQMYG